MCIYKCEKGLQSTVTDLFAVFLCVGAGTAHVREHVCMCTCLISTLTYIVQLHSQMTRHICSCIRTHDDAYICRVPLCTWAMLPEPTGTGSSCVVCVVYVCIHAQVCIRVHELPIRFIHEGTSARITQST